MIKQEIDEDILNKNDIDNEEEVNAYYNIIINKFDRENVIASQMKQWSILSNVVHYLQYDRNPRDFYNLDIKALYQKNHRKTYDRLKEEDRQVIEIDFGNTPDKLKGEYLDMYDRVKSEVLSTTKFDENSDLSTTYLGRIYITRLDKIKAEDKFPISKQRYTVGKLLDGTDCQIQLDMGASKSFMSKPHYSRCKSVCSLTKFASKTQRIQVGNGQYVSALFIIPIVIDEHGFKLDILLCKAAWS